MKIIFCVIYIGTTWINLFCQSYTEALYKLNDVTIKLSQFKSNGNENSCNSKILISNIKKNTDTLEFESNAVGGSYGVSSPKLINDHLIFTIHGDYDGRTLIINNKGKYYNIIGGKYYFDKKSNFLFSIYESDISGIAVFNLNNDTLLYLEQEIIQNPISIYKSANEKYFFSYKSEDDNYLTKYMEIDLKRSEIKPITLNEKNINTFIEMVTWTEDVICECKKI